MLPRTRLPRRKPLPPKRRPKPNQLRNEVELALEEAEKHGKARELNRRAEKIFQTIYADMDKISLADVADDLRTTCAQQLRKLLQFHLRAAQESGNATEVAELQQLLKTYQ